MAEGDGLLNRCRTLKFYRGFESLRLRFSCVDFQRFVKVVFGNPKDPKDFFTKLELIAPDFDSKRHLLSSKIKSLPKTQV